MKAKILHEDKQKISMGKELCKRNLKLSLLVVQKAANVLDKLSNHTMRFLKIPMEHLIILASLSPLHYL
jgi:hypothetical protein